MRGTPRRCRHRDVADGLEVAADDERQCAGSRCAGHTSIDAPASRVRPSSGTLRGPCPTARRPPADRAGARCEGAQEQDPTARRTVDASRARQADLCAGICHVERRASIWRIPAPGRVGLPCRKQHACSVIDAVETAWTTHPGTVESRHASPWTGSRRTWTNDDRAWKRRNTTSSGRHAQATTTSCVLGLDARPLDAYRRRVATSPENTRIRGSRRPIDAAESRPRDPRRTTDDEGAAATAG